MAEAKLERSLGPLLLWGLGVGYVISGMYFGWNLGLEKGGTLGLGIATFFVAIFYITFSLSYTELACAIPKAGGAFDYAERAFGRNIALWVGLAQWIEFVFAPPAIALGIGSYFHLLFPQFDVVYYAVVAYFLFTLLNAFGVKASALFELIITIVAVVELLIFVGFTLPYFKPEHLTINAFPFGFQGVFAAIPFAIWFFLGLEGIANVAEETIHPQKNVLKGFSSAIITLIVLASLVFISAVGVGGWEKVVYTDTSHSQTSDSPLPMAMKMILGENNIYYHLLVTIGLFGFIASFNGLLLAAGRAAFELGRTGFAPAAIGRIHPKTKAPIYALMLNMAVGILALFTGKTNEIITIAVMGALSMYVAAMFSFFRLRNKEKKLSRPFNVPFYPYFPATALFLGIVCLVAVAYFNLTLTVIYLGLLITLFGLIKSTSAKK